MALEIGGLLKGAHAVAHAGEQLWSGLTAKVGVAAARAIAGGSALAVIVGGGALISGGDVRYDGSLCPPGTLAAIAAPASAKQGTDKGGEGGGHTDASQEAVAKHLYAVFGGLGMSDENIAGILGNVQVESGFNPGIVQGGGTGTSDNQAMLGQVGGSGHAIGLFQWDSGRATALVKYAIAHNKPWNDIDLQLQFLFNGDGANVDLAKKMITTPMGSPEEAAHWWNTNWERSADTSGARAANAKSWFARMGGWSKLSPDEAHSLVGSVDAVADDTGGKGKDKATVTPAVLSRCCAQLQTATSAVAKTQTGDAGHGTGTGTPDAASFLAKFGDDIDNVARKYNIPAIVIIAQAGAESSYGTAGAAVGSNNPWNFGYTPYLDGLDGYLGKDSDGGRSTTNWADAASAANGYGMLLATDGRYAKAFEHATDPAAFVNALQDAGYDAGGAQDHYAAKITALFGAVEDAAHKAGRTLYMPSGNGNPIGDKVHKDGSTPSGGTDGVTQAVSDGAQPLNVCGVTKDAADVAKGSLGSITEACVDAPGVVEQAKKLKGMSDEKLTKAVSWAIGVACNNHIGYSQSRNPPLTQDGPTTQNYESTDCSNLIAMALMYNGFGSGPFATGSEAAELAKAGFKEVGTSNDVGKLKPGDILWYDNGGMGHTVWYLGEGLDVAAHGAFEGDGIHGSPGDTMPNPALHDSYPHAEVSVSRHDTDPQLNHVWRYQG